jgi:leucyl/phenylalanyl-tRNA--protein transferase
MLKMTNVRSPFKPGPDPDFPYLDESDFFPFSDPKNWDDDIVAVGGNLSPGMLLSAYEQGIFPWYNPGDPVIWQSPDPRCIIFPDKLHVSSSMQKIFNNNVFEIKFDNDFIGVITGCAQTKRRNQNGTWISDDIIKAYAEMFRLGWAHSAEAWHEGELAGGCYGVIMGRAFFGESMFSRKSNASKAAFLCFAQKLFENNFAFIDCQVPTPHLLSLGGEAMSRNDFLSLLKKHEISRW